MVPLPQVATIWRKQRAESARLIGLGKLGRRKKNHAENGRSPTLWLRDDRAPSVAELLWNSPGVVDLMTPAEQRATPPETINDDTGLAGEDSFHRPLRMRDDWTDAEVGAIVADYFEMLASEFAGRPYSKTEHRRRLVGQLRGRTEASIEFKHRNISAVLRDLHWLWIPGYKPASNYQERLSSAVERRVSADSDLNRLALAAVSHDRPSPRAAGPLKLVAAPEVTGEVQEQRASSFRARTGMRPDYIALENNNRALGTAGELAVVEYEAQRLREAGARTLSKRVEHVAQSRGDGLGYDVLSFEVDGRERFIEVKTTAYDKHTPFLISRGEVAFSERAAGQYRLYRLFEFPKRAQMFELVGAVRGHCRLDPMIYKALIV